MTAVLYLCSLFGGIYDYTTIFNCIIVGYFSTTVTVYRGVSADIISNTVFTGINHFQIAPYISCSTGIFNSLWEISVFKGL